MRYNRRIETNTQDNMTELEAKLATARAELEAVEAEIAASKSAARAGNIATVRALMNEHGLTMADIGRVSAVTTASTVAKARVPVAPKYRNSVGETWAGRGARPTWLQKALASGFSLDEFKIAA